MSKVLHVTAEGIKKKFKISPIEFGIVIDHIPAGEVDRVVKTLELTLKDKVMIGKNFDSLKTGIKDILKVEGYSIKRLTQEIQDKIAVICRNGEYPTKIHIIEKGNKIKRIELELPDVIINALRCFNPKCITIMEPHTVLQKKFYVLRKNPLLVKCHYCERKMREQEITLLEE